jgi:rhamnulokinase
MKTTSFLAFDIGASSGRALRGTLGEQGLALEEVLRFRNAMVSRHGRLHWDAPRIFRFIKKGIKAALEGGRKVESIGLDTWGVDFGLVDGRGELVTLPFAYRDERNAAAMKDCFSLIPRDRIYALTGIQFLQFNSLYQLHALGIHNPRYLEKARRLLFMPDIFNFWMTGEKTTEFSFATTSQLFNPVSRTWEREIFDAVGISPTIMNPVSYAGKRLGELKSGLVEELGLSSPVTVVLTATHDTASAVAAVPARGEDWAFISSGTWSIMGILRGGPVVDSLSLEKNFTNEGGWDGSFRFSKNISGLWLLQECLRIWSLRKNEAFSYQALTAMAEAAPALRSHIDPDAPVFLKPEDMPKAIQSFCRSSDQPVPESKGEIVRCILESLALKYRYVLAGLRRSSGVSVNRLHVIGGGVRNRLLCRFTAEATGLPVHAGPVEATAVGNLMIQALAVGAIRSAEEMKSVIARSFKPRLYKPENTVVWERAFGRFSALVESAGEKESHERI